VKNIFIIFSFLLDFKVEKSIITKNNVEKNYIWQSGQVGNVERRHSMAKYAKHIANPETPQKEQAKATQVKARNGGFVFKVDDWKRLDRFLIIGNENGSYYASERQLTGENYDCILRCLKLDSKRTVDQIVTISSEGRAVKNDPALFALAVCSVHGDDVTRAYANKVMPKVARFSTAFFTYVDAVISLKDGRKGKGLLRAMGRWYTGKDAVKLAYQVCKYPGRSVGDQRWTHKDMLRMCRPSRTTRNGKALQIPSEDHAKVFHYVTHGVTTAAEVTKRKAEFYASEKKQEAAGLSTAQFDALKDSKLKYIWGHEKCRKATDIKEVVKLVSDFNLTRESVPQHFRNELEVQRALLPGMPMTALIRNLGSMTSSGLLKSLSSEVSDVVDKITDENNLQRARVHPMTIMMAMKTYSNGAGMRTTWKPVSAIKDALEDAFYKAFKFVEPTGKRFLFGIDVSGSMGGFYWGQNDKSGLSAREAAAVVAMTCARTEKNYEMMAFSHQFIPLNITARDSYDTVIKRTSSLSFGGTDCALPMTWAMKKELEVDVFVILTDSETHSGGIHPFEALKKYRKAINPEAKLAVLAFESSGFTIADPSDAGMIDIAGLDANVPKILSEFAAGRL
jgi:60 kDa SS-A/Ro ribonucleoprotein